MALPGGDVRYDIAVEDEKVRAYAIEVGVEPDEGLRVLQFQAEASKWSGEIEKATGDRFLFSEFTPGRAELIIHVTDTVTSDSALLARISSADLPGTVRIEVESDQVVSTEAPRSVHCPVLDFGTELDVGVEVSTAPDSASVTAGSTFSGIATITNNRSTRVVISSNGTLNAFVYLPSSDDILAVSTEPQILRDLTTVIEPGESVDLPFSGGTVPCGEGAPETLGAGEYDVRILAGLGLSEPVTITVT